MERLQKIIGAAGITSRRKAEQLITDGRVAVNGTVVRELGAKADASRDQIRVDGRLISKPERNTYLMLNKPKGYVTTVSDPEGRPTIMDLVRGKSGARVYPVGRLDWASEGLLLLTNDGAIAHKLTRAATHVPKTYMVKISGKPTEENIAKLRAGITLPGESRLGRTVLPVKTAPAQIRLAQDAPNPWYEVALIEGRNRQIRRMFEKIGHHVEKIKRTRYGPLTLDLEPGQIRPLSLAEISALKRATGEKTGQSARPASRSASRPRSKRK